MVAQVVDSGLATLWELREKYSMREMYGLWEVVYRRNYNKWQAYENAKKARKRRQ